MWKRHLSFSISFGSIALLNLFIEAFNIQEVRVVVRPLVCVLLSGYLLSKTRLYGAFSKLIFFGLLFSLAGEIALIFSAGRSIVFLTGLGLFVIAKLFYSIAFFRDYRYNVQASKKYGNRMLAALALFWVPFFIWIQPFLNGMTVLAWMYIFAISATAILAGFRYRRVNPGSFRTVLTGTIFFIVSDTLLVVNEFVTPFLYSGVFIMAAYMLAQYLITIGTLERITLLKKKPQI